MATAKKPAKAGKATKAAKADTATKSSRAVSASKAATATRSAKSAKPAPRAGTRAASAPRASAAAGRATAGDSAARVPVLMAGPAKPVKDVFTKTSLAAHLAETANVEPRAVKAVLAALENTLLGSLHRKGRGEFTMPGLLKIVVQQVPAKKRRFGKDPFTGEERWFDAKPASVKVKVRPMKKIKDAAA